MAFGNSTEREIRRRLAIVRRMANKYADMIEREMKQSHPWQNRTGAAEASLYARPRIYRDTVNEINSSIDAGYEGIDYGYWLEMANSGRYSIVRPTMQKYIEQIEQEMRDTWNSSGMPMDDGGGFDGGGLDDL